MVKWIDGSIKEWNCEHVNKCSVIIEHDGDVYMHNTDHGEPGHPYKYIFENELYRESGYLVEDRRDRIPCDCKKKSIIKFRV